MAEPQGPNSEPGFCARSSHRSPGRPGARPGAERRPGSRRPPRLRAARAPGAASGPGRRRPQGLREGGAAGQPLRAAPAGAAQPVRRSVQPHAGRRDGAVALPQQRVLSRPAGPGAGPEPIKPQLAQTPACVSVQLPSPPVQGGLRVTGCMGWRRGSCGPPGPGCGAGLRGFDPPSLAQPRPCSALQRSAALIRPEPLLWLSSGWDPGEPP